ncbi:MAG: alpha/beta hydrolase [Candidatus Electrothrix sp. EH2]|nr:alpha/beta hydrolase [Candidatus Electrothrix sp. EH2]
MSCELYYFIISKKYFFRQVLLLALFCLPCLLMWMLMQGCSHSEKATENVMDSPEVQRILFHPRTTEPSSLPAGAQEIAVEVAPGVFIGCRFFAAGKENATILFFHGNGEIVSDYDLIGPEYIRSELNILVTDYRGYGWSDGEPSFSALLADSHVLYTELKKMLAEQGYREAIFIMGRSLGSAPAIELAQKYNEEISGLIIESGFAETLPLAETLGADIASMNISEEQTFNNVGKIRDVTKPTFLLHGQRDTLIPLWQAERLHAESGARVKELQVVPGADHNSLISVGGKYYFMAIQQFIAKTTGDSDWRTRRKNFKKRQALAE